MKSNTQLFLVSATATGFASLLLIGCSRPNVDERSEDTITLQAKLSVAEDADQDDVRNELDLCASTPGGEFTDGDGCGLATQDADLDGVGNGRDSCPNTAAGFPVDAMGCARIQGGELPILPANLRDTGDVFDLPGWNPTATACGGGPIPRVDVDLDGDGAADTMVVVSSVVGQAFLNSTGSIPSTIDRFLSLNPTCVAPMAAEINIRFVNMLAPGFDRDNASTWSFRTVPAARLDFNSDFIGGTRWDATGFTPAGLPAVAFNSLRRIFSHRDGIAVIRASTDYPDSLVENLRILSQPPNTRFGTNVTINLDNGRVNFPSVTTPGNTLIRTRAATGAEVVPSDVSVCGPTQSSPSVFVVETSATAASPSQMCVKYAPGCAGPPTGVLAFRTICGLSGCTQAWQPLAMSVDSAAGVACFNPGLSPFILLGAVPVIIDPPPIPVVDLPIITGMTRVPGGWILTYSFTPPDAIGPGTCVPPSGSPFAPGEASISCVAEDASGNPTTATFAIILPPLKAPGGSCDDAETCASMFCIDGVCCQDACGSGDVNDCQACSVAAGGSIDGICALRDRGDACYTATDFCEESQVCSGSSSICPSPALPADECTATSDDPSTCDGEPACVELLGGTDTEGGIELTFLAPYEGDVRVEATGQGCPPTTGFEVLSMDADHGSGTYFDITADPPTGLPQMKICIHYPQGSMPEGGPQEQGLRIEHGTTTGCGGTGDWTELIEAEPPDQPDMVNNIICGYTDSLSPFAIFVPLDADGPVFGNLPGTIVAHATSTAGAKVSYALPTAVDAVDGPVPVGCLPASGAIFPPGKTKVTCEASDTTGHTSSATFTVWVQYQAPADGSFFLKPPRANGSSIFRIGKPVPVKFQLTGASKNVTNLQAHLIVTKLSGAIQGTVDDDCDEDDDDTDFLFRFRKGKGLYVYRWKTRGETQGTYALRADLGDEVVHEVNVSLKRPPR